MTATNTLDLDAIITRVSAICSEQLGVAMERITPGTRLIEDLNCDSLDLVELLMGLEDEFGVSLPDDSDDPVYKAVFTRSPFRIHDLGELVYVRLGVSGSGARTSNTWLGNEEPQIAVAHPFSQLCGSRADAVTPIEQIGSDDSGRRLFRRRIDGMRCVLVPGGTCRIGCDFNEADEAPSHEVELSSFLLDIETVSVGAYARFLNSVGVTDDVTLRDWTMLDDEDRRHKHMPIQFSDGVWSAREGTARWPMILVSWYGANAYSLWANGLDCRQYKECYSISGRTSTLPSEAQWEYAARGPAYREYPWGDSAPNSALARFGCHRRGHSYEMRELPLCDVNGALGVSPFGALHMAGNVWQWCADWYDPRFYASVEASASDPLNRESSGVRAERGGSWIGTGALLRTSYRRGRHPRARGRCLGFRCTGMPPAHSS